MLYTITFFLYDFLWEINQNTHTAYNLSSDTKIQNPLVYNQAINQDWKVGGHISQNISKRMCSTKVCQVCKMFDSEKTFKCTIIIHQPLFIT